MLSGNFSFAIAIIGITFLTIYVIVVGHMKVAKKSVTAINAQYEERKAEIKQETKLHWLYKTVEESHRREMEEVLLGQDFFNEARE